MDTPEPDAEAEPELEPVPAPVAKALAVTAPIRVDRWLWAVRLYKSRSAATTACSKGEVRIEGQAAKPARRVKPGDTVEVKRREFVGVYKVISTIEKRVGAPIAVHCYEDLTPERPEKNPIFEAPESVRERGAGRPTKRERRALDKLRGR